ncbi:MAG: ABC transporter substrate-binding protein [Chloroflexi bacterium]|nr:ABC transporter substrate-binding protein [Chloroflexota bacterium]
MKTVKYLLTFVMLTVFLASCATPAAETVKVIETVIVEGTPVVEVKEVEVEKVVTATPAETDKYGGTFTWGVSDEVPGFNPILNNWGTEIVIFQTTSQPLTWGGENFPSDVVPILAESWERSEDGLVWTLHLRQGVTWSDGVPFTADDVLFTAQAIQDEATTGAEWVRGRYFVNDVPFKFEKVDDYTVTITTVAPVPTLLNDICACIIPQHYFVENGISNADMKASEFNTSKNIGTGPFILEEYRPGEAAIMKANENYWGGKPYLDTIVFRLMPDVQSRIVALQAGEIDFTGISPQYVAELIDNPDITIFTKTVDMQYHLRLNVTKPMLADKRTRQALFYALDRAAMVQTLKQGYGQVADSPYNPAVTAYEATTTYSYDVEKAKALLTEVGWVMGSDGIWTAETVEGVEPGTKFSIVLDVLYDEDESVMVLTQSFWKELGIDATIRQIDPNVWAEENNGMVEKKYDVYYSGIGYIGTNGVNYQWLMANGALDNSMSYGNETVIELFNQAKTTEDATERDALLKEAGAIVWDELPFMPIYYDKRVYAANNKVHFEEADWQVGMVGIFGAPDKIWIEK